ncbi:MAG: hypothetical protein ACO28M_11595 [Vulcanococcus sp.]
MPRFTDPNKLAKHLKDSLSNLQAETLITAQSELGSTKISPYDTGRFRSSWFATEGTASGDVASVGTDSPNTDATGLKVDAYRNYYLTNNLPYAQSIAIEGKVVSQPATWFTDFRNSRLPKIQETAAKVVKARFEL